jgi:hypothetical protein
MWITFNLGDGSLYWKRQLLKTPRETIFQFREISEDVLKDKENSTKMDLGSNIG